MSYKVKLNIFEGPFDLLVYLIENAEMSIYDIRVSEITAQYLRYIEQMREQDVMVGAEFLVLAATLIELKSKMLLPRIRVDGEIEEDPRTDLTQKLALYTKYKKLAALLEAQLDEAALKHTKPQEDLSPFTGEPDEFLRMDVQQFVAAFKAFLYKRQKGEELQRIQDRIAHERMTVANKKNIIGRLLAKAKDGVLRFRELLAAGQERYDKVVTFVSLLEMAKAGLLRVGQEGNFTEIAVYPPDAPADEVIGTATAGTVAAGTEAAATTAAEAEEEPAQAGAADGKAGQ
ncbi:MAG: segregation/condensation protein A [Clostridiales Family XIII bacterium]|jgi:segregation and condensation protein A|nr:segregation/condensation protein A [Clostridiales Family XIII bacterium]